MNCRADVVEAQLFSAMKDAGLYLVYMGLESGTEGGLDVLHKQINVEQNIRAVETLKSIGLGFEYGFMLLDPSSTFDSVRANVRFLRRIVGDGSAAATFCRMVPYDGTPIKDQLMREGRFKGDINHPEYDFLDARLDAYYRELLGIVDVTGWIHGYRALSPQLNWAWHETAVLERLFPPLDGLDEYKRFLGRLTAQSNEMLFRIVDQLADVYTDGAPRVWSGEELQERAGSYLEELVTTRDAFIGRHQEVLMRALGEPARAAAAG
jgi:anaerobic magnesium-protoporphyrin IX monomethyl ester cyclase